MQDHKFQYALTLTLQEEGGYGFDPEDPGGETKFGISMRSYPHLNIKELTLEQASDIYYRDYWMKAGCYWIESEAIAAKLFDLAVNTGPRSAVKFLQHGVNVVCTGEIPAQRQARWRQKITRLLGGKPLLVDGYIGKITAEVVNGTPYQDAIMMALCGEVYCRRYRRGKAIYRAGWLERLLP